MKRIPADMYDPVFAALAEDVGPGDVTAAFFVPQELKGIGRIVAKQDAILSGIGTAASVFARVDPSLESRVICESGTRVSAGDAVLEIAGPVRSILTGERAALNFVQRLSGVATLTRRFVEAIAGTDAEILDTRKTTPGLRGLEKQAVKDGGGRNHRFGLYDMAMVKDNHLAAGSVDLQEAINRLHSQMPHVRIELEADTLDQVKHFLTLEGVDVVLLDNMSLDQMREAVRMTAGRVKLEASGGVTLDTVADIARTGVDYVSVGALTHSAPAADFSLELEHGAR